MPASALSTGLAGRLSSMSSAPELQPSQSASGPQPQSREDPTATADHRPQRAELSLKVAAALAKCDSLDDVPAMLAALTADALGAEHGLIFLCDDATGALYPRVASGGTAEERCLHPFRLHPPGSIVGHVFATGIGQIVADVSGDRRFDPSIDQPAGVCTRNLICAPVMLPDGVRLGVVQCLNKRHGTFDATDLDSLLTIAGQAAAALRMVRMLDTLNRARALDERCLQLVADMAALTSADELPAAVMPRVGRLLDADRARLVLHPASADERGPVTPAIGTEDGIAFIEHVLRTGESLTRPPIASTSGTGGSGSALCVPVAGQREQPIAALLVQDKRGGGRFSSDDERRLRMIAVHVANTLRNAHLTGEVEAMQTDNHSRARTAFARYLDPQLADRVLSRSDDVLGGRCILATILFADIRDFSGLSLNLGPKQTLALLNQYFTHMLACLERTRGVLDKFIGDALMATFGVPAFSGDEDDRAVETAVAMQRRMAHWNCERSAAGLPTLDIGIGIHTDLVVSGNVGSPERMNYTVIGNGVNLASRLQQVSKHYRTPVLISDRTAQRLRRPFRLRPVDSFLARGQAQPVLIHEVIDHFPESAFPEPERVVQHFAAGIEAYRRRRFDRALPEFERALDLHPDDYLSHLYRKRCRIFLDAPPPEDWNGVWPMDRG